MKYLLLIFILFSSNLLSLDFGSSSINFKEKIQEKCGVSFYNNSGIVFRNESIKDTTKLKIYSNLDTKVFLKFSSFRKSVNLNNISNSKIYIILNRNKRFSINTLVSKGLKLKKGFHEIYVRVDKQRDNLKAGEASIQFEIESICK